MVRPRLARALAVPAPNVLLSGLRLSPHYAGPKLATLFASDPELGRRVALKVLSQAAGLSPEARLRFVREARAAAIALGRGLAAFPQRCMRGDRRSALEQWGLSEDAAMRNEFAIGLETIASGETVSGAQRFRDGAGRHGAFTEEE